MAAHARRGAPVGMTSEPTGVPAVRGPVHVVGEVLATKRAGAYRHLTIAAPGLPERFRAGNFVAVSVGDGRLARRPLWIHRVKETGAFGPTLDVVVEPRGPGSTWLADLPVGARLPVTGPLGRPFALPREPVSCVLVGEGYAAAPLFPLAARLRERGCPVTLVLARRRRGPPALRAGGPAQRPLGQRRSPATAPSACAATCPPRSRPSSSAPTPTSSTPPGPRRPCAAVAAAAERRGAWSQVALETPMACGTGLCQGCPVPVVAEDGVTRRVRACVDGPVVRGDRVHWGELG